MKRLCFLIFFSTLVLSFPAGFKRLTCGFKLAKMHFDHPFRLDWEVDPILSQDQLHAILTQPFSYLGKGAQCYVLQSADGRYVIKLFRYDASLRQCPAKREKLFTACLLAYHRAREETGVLYLHLNLTSNALPVLHAQGPLGQSLSLPLDLYRFAIQKKASPFRAALLAAQASQDPTALPQLIDSFVDVVYARLAKGIGNSDPTVSRNFGFFEGKALEIDFGNYFAHPAPHLEELHRYTRRLRRWLQHHAPEHTLYLDQKVAECESF